MRALLLQALVILALAATATVLTWKFHPRAPALYLQQDALAEGEIGYLETLVSQQSYAQSNQQYFDAMDAAWQATTQLELQLLPR